MSKHVAEQSTASRIREHQAWAIRNITVLAECPGFGKHRAEESK